MNDFHQEKSHTQRKSSKNVQLNLSMCAYAVPVQYSLRPLGTLFNPYSTNCSIFCNHPSSSDVKSILRNVKNVSKHLDERNESKRCHSTASCRNVIIESDDQIPDEFYERFAGNNDSRPQTPTPSSLSTKTRISGNSVLLQPRRCLTPDPLQCDVLNSRKQIVVDLRRSHSQETLYWNASSEISMPLHDIVSTNAGSDITPSGKRNMRICEQEAHKRSIGRKKPDDQQQNVEAPIVCINDRHEIDDEAEGQKRRGRKKKKCKTQNRNAFHMSNEPETLIATIDPDSPNGSARPSLVPKESTLRKQSTDDKSTNYNLPNRIQQRQCSFISEDALKILQRGLNIEIVENAFERFVSKMKTIKT